MKNSAKTLSRTLLALALVLSMLLAVPFAIPQAAAANAPCAMLTDDGELLFYNGDGTSPAVIGGETYSGTVYTGVANTSYDSIPWFEQRLAIKTVRFVDSITVTNTEFWFAGCSNLTAVKDINKLYIYTVSRNSSVAYMFLDCYNLTDLDMFGFDTFNVSDMCCMFYNCSSLTELDLSNFSTDRVTDMTGMFSGCSGLQELNLSNFTTGNVESMIDMFWGCTSLIELDLRSFDTRNVGDMTDMFWKCKALNRVVLGENFRFTAIDGNALLPTPSGAGFTGRWMLQGSPETARTAAELQTSYAGGELTGAWVRETAN